MKRLEAVLAYVLQVWGEAAARCRIIAESPARDEDRA